MTHGGVDGRWAARAACAGLPVAVFYPDRHHKASDAKAVCAGCPVRPECLEDAMGRADYHGVWGGFSAEERRAIRRARNLERKAMKGENHG